MKKLISALLALILVLSITACGTPNDPASKDSGNNTNTQKPPVSNAVLPDFQKTATISETVLYDENDIRITANELTYNEYAAELSLTIENNSDKDMSFYSNTYGYSCNSINGYMITDGYVHREVEANMKARASISFNYDKLMQYGIFEIADIEVGFDIKDDDDNHIYTGPCQIKTSAAEGYDYQSHSFRETVVSDAAQNTYHYSVSYFSNEIPHDQNGYPVASGGMIQYENGETHLLLEIENTTQEPVNVSTNDIYLNNLCIHSYRYNSTSIYPGKTGIVEVNISNILDNKDWKLYGIESVSTVTLTLEYHNAEFEKLCAPAVITVTDPNSAPTLNKGGKELYGKNDIRITWKGIVEEDLEYGDDIRILMLVENNSSKEISVSEVYDSFSLNSYMMSVWFYSVTMRPNTCAVLEIKLWDSELEKKKITAADQIENIKFSIEIKDTKYNKIDEPSISIVCAE